MTHLPPYGAPEGGQPPEWQRPPPPAPGWGPPVPPPPPPTRNLTVPLLLGALLIVATAGLTVLVLSGGDDDGGGSDDAEPASHEEGSDSPEAAVRRFVEADSCEDVANATTEAFRTAFVERQGGSGGSPEDYIDACEDTTPDRGGELLEVAVLSEEGDTATVEATSTLQNAEMTLVYTVKVENSEWKLDSVDDRLDDPAEDDPAPDDSALDGPLPEGLSESAEPDANDNLPEDVVADLYAAIASSDCDSMREALTESLWTEDGNLSEAEAMDQCSQLPPQDTAISEVLFAGLYHEPDPTQPEMVPETAVVVGTVETPGVEPFGTVFHLILEDDLWKIYGPGLLGGPG